MTTQSCRKDTEDRGLLSTDPIYSNYYSVTGLYERLRADAGRYPDTMDQRYGAWAQLLALFRLIYSGGSHGAMKIPAREGYLFDPDRYLFLEGRQARKDKPSIPHVPDCVAYRVLSKLLLLDGERLSYRTLAVEQIGSVYEAIMGFELQVAAAKSIAIKPAKTHGAPATINLEELLKTATDKRLKWFVEATDQKVTGQAAEGLKSAKSVEELLVALDRKIAKAVTPSVVPLGAMIFQPSNERRKSGSHYTPSSLTGPIVEAALAPVLKQLGDSPKPQQVLNLKICDPAMGSGAFLVQACRQLGDELMKAWHAHNDLPVLPPDEEEALHAQRIVAQRCLYGVDKNPMAVDLAKLSLWLATLAKDHPFTFLDHSLRHGDSLVGLTRQQMAAFHWGEEKQQSFLEQIIRTRIERVSQYRQRILAARDDVPYAQLKQELQGADEALQLARVVGDTIVAAFLCGDKARVREQRRMALRAQTDAMLKDSTNTEASDSVERAVSQLSSKKNGTSPFHWQLEFPEVFPVERSGSQQTGFDVIVGNPPFLGGTRISEEKGMAYFAWLTTNYPKAGHLCDLVAYFFRRCFQLLREGGVFGLIATNTISQGDTREGGLAPILQAGGEIYSAVRRLRWPGEAAVVVSVVHVAKSYEVCPISLDRQYVNRISAFLLEGSVDRSPFRLQNNPYFSSGTKIYGQGFLFDDMDPDANPLVLLQEVLERDATCQSRIFPYIGGEEVNSSPSHRSDRHVIFLSDIKDEDELLNWPLLAEIVKRKVKPERDLLGDNPNNVPLKRRWWAYQAHRPELYERVWKLERVLVNSQTSGHLAFAFLPPCWIYSQKLNVFEISSFSGFCVVQSRVHEIWARFFGSSLKDDLCYTPSDCFETYPFPADFSGSTSLVKVGSTYYEFRAELMMSNNEGLTKTYNRFNSPAEDSPAIIALRKLHSEMDRAVLDSYGWNDIHPECEFVLEFADEEEDEEETGHAKKRKYRYRWSDSIREEVLARLLDLNRQRALGEGQIVTDGSVVASREKQTKTNDT